MIQNELINLITFKLSTMFGQENVSICSSGTDALYHLLSTIGFEDTDLVLIPSFLCERVILPFIKLKIQFKLIDVEENFILPSLEQYMLNYSTNVKAILLPYLFGYTPHRFEEILDWAKKSNIIVIEDIASSFGLHYSGKLLGTNSQYAFGSFGYDKLLSVGGLGFFFSGKQVPFFSLGRTTFFPRFIDYNSIVKKVRIVDAHFLSVNVIKLLAEYFNYFAHEIVTNDLLEQLNHKLDIVPDLLETRKSNVDFIFSQFHSTDRIKLLSPKNDEFLTNRVACVINKTIYNNVLNALRSECCWVGQDYVYPIHKWFPNNEQYVHTMNLSSRIINIVTNPKNKTLARTIEILNTF